jgi:hypothetical protein
MTKLAEEMARLAEEIARLAERNDDKANTRK